MVRRDVDRRTVLTPAQPVDSLRERVPKPAVWDRWRPWSGDTNMTRSRPRCGARLPFLAATCAAFILPRCRIAIGLDNFSPHPLNEEGPAGRQLGR